MAVIAALGIARLLIFRNSAWPPSFFDILHMVLGGVLAFLWSDAAEFFGLPRSHQTFMAVTGVACLAIALEIVQPLWGEERDFWDVLATISGAAAFVGWTQTAQSGLIRMGWRFAAVMAVMFGVSRPMLILSARWWQRRMHPCLASFESPLETMLWTARGCVFTRSHSVGAVGHFALRVEVKDRVSYPGVSISGPFQSWDAYRSLNFSVWVDTNESAPKSLSLRIDDRVAPDYADRFQGTYPLAPGWNTLSVELKADLRTERGRGLDKQNILSMTFFLEDAEPGAVFYLDDIRLAP